ncbi:uncharacterized protein V6R79_001808 [Siganus canaliculatus]
MGRYKCAYSCEHSDDSDVKFFKFPLYNPKRLKKWLSNMKLKDWTPSRFSVLCMNHFEEQCIDRTGKTVKLREDAVPTIFSPPDDSPNANGSSNRRQKKSKPPADEVSQTSSMEGKKSEKWRIIVDEGLVMIKSFPEFFHGDYCVPQDIHWAPDKSLGTEWEDPEKIIMVKEAWQWLGMDVRGPLPQTLNGHRYILTVTDYFSKWVEAVPMQSSLPSHVVKHIVDIIDHFGYPVRILSRLPHDIVHKINRELKDQLKVTIALVVHHQQTETADLMTQQQIDRMVNGLIEEHATDWDVYLPAEVFSLCFKEHSQTKERPFSLLCCNGLEPVRSPRGLNYTYSKIQESIFLVT